MPPLIDTLIVGAGPTGLALAAGLARFGAHFRLIDRAIDRVHESRALGVQARTLEILESLGLGEALVRRGNPSARLLLHLDARRAAEARLDDFGGTDTRFPFILFVSQAETEALLGDHLASLGVAVDRGFELIGAVPEPDCVRCRIRRPDGTDEEIRARYVVGCDGAHSTVRKRAGIPFEGDAYLQDFMLGDIEVDGPLERGAIHSFAIGRGVAMFFPLGAPTTWRVIAARGGAVAVSRASSDATPPSDLPLAELQQVVDEATGGGLILHDAAWLSRFRLHHRQAVTYRAGRMFLAGDAAHIHSPVGAQGMNTGIQDAWNLAWKLALVVRGTAGDWLLDSYQAERWPVGHLLLRYTDRAFGMFTRAISGAPAAAWFRRVAVARILPRILTSKPLRARVFHFVSQLGVRYRNSPAVAEGSPRLRTGPRAGDRFPDGMVEHAGRPMRIHEAVAGARLHLVLCGARDRWDRLPTIELARRAGGLVAVHYLEAGASADGLVDPGGGLLSRLGVVDARDAAQYLVRPDGHIGFRCAGSDLDAVSKFLDGWLGRDAS